MNTHNIPSFTSCQEEQNKPIQPFIVTLKYHIYLSLVKITNKCIQFFGTLFAHFHSSIMALGKELFTLPVALENQNERKLWSRAMFR